jgi:hypothetical protein
MHQPRYIAPARAGLAAFLLKKQPPGESPIVPLGFGTLSALATLAKIRPGSVCPDLGVAAPELRPQEGIWQTVNVLPFVNQGEE